MMPSFQEDFVDSQKLFWMSFDNVLIKVPRETKLNPKP